MSRHTEEPNINFINQPDIGYVWEVLLNLLSTQNGWNRNFTVTATLKNEFTDSTDNEDIA